MDTAVENIQVCNFNMCNRDSADVGDGGAGIGPVTYPTPFPDPPVSSPGKEIQWMPFSK